MLRSAPPSICSALIFSHPTPNSAILVGCECELQAILLRLTLSTYGFSILDLFNSRTGCTDWEEQVWISITTRSYAPPFIAHGRIGRVSAFMKLWHSAVILASGTHITMIYVTDDNMGQSTRSATLRSLAGTH